MAHLYMLKMTPKFKTLCHILYILQKNSCQTSKRVSKKGTTAPLMSVASATRNVVLQLGRLYPSWRTTATFLVALPELWVFRTRESNCRGCGLHTRFSWCEKLWGARFLKCLVSFRALSLLLWVSSALQRATDGSSGTMSPLKPLKPLKP